MRFPVCQADSIVEMNGTIVIGITRCEVIQGGLRGNLEMREVDHATPISEALQSETSRRISKNMFT